MNEAAENCKKKSLKEGGVVEESGMVSTISSFGSQYKDVGQMIHLTKRYKDLFGLLQQFHLVMKPKRNKNTK